ncbi:hypothetical protein, partial [Pseudorhizobium marinum]|uniref:hypothetical protein n=1 Tax=Pseudorhizobium marinum TaxID=1496690 RepID=UPI001AEC688C
FHPLPPSRLLLKTLPAVRRFFILEFSKKWRSILLRGQGSAPIFGSGSIAADRLILPAAMRRSRFLWPFQAVATL